MTKVLHTRPSRLRPRCLGGLAAALAIGLSTVCVAVFAGEVGASFRITINVLPESAGSCSASSSTGAPQVTCRPSVVGVTAAATGSRDPTVLRYRNNDQGLRVAGEMIEVGNENYYAWNESQPVAWSETSTRLVLAGGREYVETTVSW